MIYTTKQNDILDKICHDYYGRSSAIADVLAANHGLEDQPLILQVGLQITLPTLPDQPATESTVSLWD